MLKLVIKELVMFKLVKLKLVWLIGQNQVLDHVQPTIGWWQNVVVRFFDLGQKSGKTQHGTNGHLAPLSSQRSQQINCFASSIPMNPLKPYRRLGWLLDSCWLTLCNSASCAFASLLNGGLENIASDAGSNADPSGCVGSKSVTVGGAGSDLALLGSSIRRLDLHRIQQVHRNTLQVG